jgi:hypothetical protein
MKIKINKVPKKRKKRTWDSRRVASRAHSPRCCCHDAAAGVAAVAAVAAVQVGVVIVVPGLVVNKIKIITK